MLRIDRHTFTLEPLQSQKLAEAGYRECEDLQELIARNPDTFFREIGEPFLVIGKEVQPLKPLGDSIDILAIDQEGKAVIFELKRGKDKLQLLQSITYASMISKWQPEQFIDERAKFTKKPFEHAAHELGTVLAGYLANLNNKQRIILIAEEFDPSVLVSAKWLNEQYELEIECFQLGLSKGNGADFLSCSRVYPPAAGMQFAGPRRMASETSSNWPNWETALAEFSNSALREFFVAQTQQTPEGPECRLKYRDIIWRIKGERQFYVSGRTKYAYVWQSRRFKGDIAFWRSRLTAASNLNPVNTERSIRFHLRAPRDFQAFLKAVTVELVDTDFSRPFGKTSDQPWNKGSIQSCSRY